MDGERNWAVSLKNGAEIAYGRDDFSDEDIDIFSTPAANKSHLGTFNRKHSSSGPKLS